MMEVYRTPSNEIQDIVFANVTYDAVINGLNGYFASEPRNDYITVKMGFDDIKQDFALHGSEAWADILISWLRTEHGIFYYPGMEAKYAKSERIPPLTERLMDEGALKSLKDLHKRVIGEEAGTNSHTLIADGIKYFVNGKESEIKKLKKEIENTTETNCKDIMDYIRQEASRNGFDLPEKVDGAPLSIERTFHDLLELLKKRDTEIKETRKKHWNDLRDIHKMLGSDDTYDNTDDFAKAVKARAECFYRSVGGETQKSDINALIRDYCTKNDIIAPSRYFSDKACVEYLFSVVDLKQKNRAAVILQELYRDIFKKQPNGLSAEDIANRILDKVLENEWAKDEIENLRGQISRLKDLINAMNEEVKDM